MKCEDVLERLQAAENEDSYQEKAVQEHIQDCDACQLAEQEQADLELQAFVLEGPFASIELHEEAVPRPEDAFQRLLQERFQSDAFLLKSPAAEEKVEQTSVQKSLTEEKHFAPRSLFERIMHQWNSLSRQTAIAFAVLLLFLVSPWERLQDPESSPPIRKMPSNKSLHKKALPKHSLRPMKKRVKNAVPRKISRTEIPKRRLPVRRVKTLPRKRPVKRVPASTKHPFDLTQKGYSPDILMLYLPGAEAKKKKMLSLNALNGQKLFPGDFIQFQYKIPKKVHIMITSINQKGEVFAFIPFQGGSSMLLQRKKGTLPSEASLELDDYIGPERFFVILANDSFTFTQVKRVLKKTVSLQSKTLHVAKRFPSQWWVKTILIQKSKHSPIKRKPLRRKKP